MRSPARILRRETEKRETRAPRRPALPTQGGRGGLQFIQDTYAELKKVVWPTRQQVVNLSLVVIGASVAVGTLLGVVDAVFTEVIKRYLVPGL